MPNKLNKKGLSNLLGALLIILSGIIGAGIILNSVTSIQTQLSPALSCGQLQLNPPIEIKSACYNQQTQELEATIQRDFSDSPINSIGFKVSSGSSIDSYTCGLSCGTGCHLPQIGETQRYYFGSENPQAIQLDIENCIIETKQIPLCN